MGACPVGAMQTFFGGLRFNLSVAEKKFGLYVAGFLAAVGSAVGRMPCGWVCPFGFFQELVHKIPSPKIKLPHFLTVLPLRRPGDHGRRPAAPHRRPVRLRPDLVLQVDLPGRDARGRHPAHAHQGRPAPAHRVHVLLEARPARPLPRLVRREPPALLPDGLPARRVMGPLQQGQPLPHGRRRPEMHALRQVHQGLPRRDQHL
ncbi:MAG: 4Fe-4S binding protein [Comamonadaceae bacterium]|nr:4Fe-4S binding protein [Comamonadaceae bacterium]